MVDVCNSKMVERIASGMKRPPFGQKKHKAGMLELSLEELGRKMFC